MFVWMWNKVNGKFWRENEFVCCLVGRRGKKTFMWGLDIFQLGSHKICLFKMERELGGAFFFFGLLGNIAFSFIYIYIYIYIFLLISWAWCFVCFFFPSFFMVSWAMLPPLYYYYFYRFFILISWVWCYVGVCVWVFYYFIIFFIFS